MAIANFESRELHYKVVYFGAHGSGKTENLRAIFRETSPEIKAGLFDLKGGGPSDYFEFLPLSLGLVEDYQVKLHLYTFWSCPFMSSVKESLLRGIDGYVVVMDARQEAFADNIRVMEETRQMLLDFGYNWGELPSVIQFNKMDEKDLVPKKILREELNSWGAKECFSVAIRAEGTMETLKLISQQIMRLGMSDRMLSTEGANHELQ